MSSEINLFTGPLDDLTRAVEDARSAYLKVGVLGDYAGRTPDENGVKRQGSELTNPQLGLWHEFGSVKGRLPERSFLRMPVMLKLGDTLANAGNSSQWAKLVCKDGVVGLLDWVGNKCIEIIAFAFHSGGFGNWQKLRPRTIRRKKNSDILIASGQLQRSVTYAVVRKGAPQVSVSPVVP